MTLKTTISILSILFISHSIARAQVNLSASNELPKSGFAVPYEPGIDYDREETHDGESPQNRIASSSVQVKANGTAGQVSTLTVDGGLSSHTKTAVDGIALDSGQLAGMDVGILPLEFAESAEVYRNNLTPRGIGASGGLINFLLPTPGLDSLKFGLYGGSYGNYGAKVVMARKAWVAGVSATLASNDFTYVDELDRTNKAVNLDYMRYALFAKYHNSRLNLGISHTGRSAGTGAKYGADFRQDDFLSTVYGNTRFGTVDFRFSYQNWVNRYYNRATGIGDDHFNHTINLDAEFPFALGALKNRVLIKSRTSFLVSTKLGKRAEQEIDGVLSGILPLGRVDLGYCINNIYVSERGYAPIPALSFNWRVVPGLQFLARVSRQYRFPSFNSLYWPDDGMASGNTNLRPEDGWRVQAGVKAFLAPVTLSASVIYSRISDLIVWMPIGGKWMPSNEDFARMIVATCGAKLVHLMGQFRLTASVSFSYNLAQNDDPDSVYYGKHILYIPLYKTSARLALDHSSGYEVWASFRQVSERFITELNNKSLAPYYLLDIGVKVKFAYVSLNNVLNQQYEEIDGYPQMGISLRGGVEFKW